ncbi:hypothetical protein SDC9_140666 [bioreactor metagenome]|uniref:Uncharacterized protein n=1 Tax=bioreactor metagenome TaxID=1076179 RepID=A0A645DVX8_9ZZZZ
MNNHFFAENYSGLLYKNCGRELVKSDTGSPKFDRVASIGTAIVTVDRNGSSFRQFVDYHVDNSTLAFVSENTATKCIGFCSHALFPLIY